MNEETSLIAFKAVCNFVNDLCSAYGKRHKPLKLYKRLVNQTQISHDQAIKKHLGVYYNFCVSNRDAIASQDASKIVKPKLSFSERVFIDMKLVFNIAEKDTVPVIWKHLLTISALLDPAGKAKDILKKNVDKGTGGANEANFLTDIISKVEQNIKPDSNPMEAVSALMQSGIFTDLMAGMQTGLSSGNLDLGKLLGTVQGMMASLGEQAGIDPETKQATGGAPPDIMKLMSSLMGGLSSGRTVPEMQANSLEPLRGSPASLEAPKTEIVEDITDEKDKGNTTEK